MDPLQQALDMLDQAAAIIQELVAQLQANQSEKSMTKKAEQLAEKTGLPIEDVSDIIKTAGENSDVLKLFEKYVDNNNVVKSFCKVANTTETPLVKTGSAAMDKYLERESELMESLNIRQI